MLKVTDIKFERVLQPITADMQGIQALFGLPPHLVRKLAADGVIRRCKLGDSLQAKTLYFVGDLIEYLQSVGAEVPAGAAESAGDGQGGQGGEGGAGATWKGVMNLK